MKIVATENSLELSAETKWEKDALERLQLRSIKSIMWKDWELSDNNPLVITFKTEDDEWGT